MAHTPHELAEEFPQHAARLHELKEKDAHFARLSDEYHTVNRQIHRAETLIEPIDELAEVQLRKRRAALKDQIARLLAA
jgi:uncharacterized protein YdcH (DUF465 family)